MQENKNQPDLETAADLDEAGDRLQRRLLAQIERFMGRMPKNKLPYAGAQRRDDGFDDLRLAKAQAKRERRAQRNLSNGLPR
jgi:hypothetical protein